MLHLLDPSINYTAKTGNNVSVSLHTQTGLHNLTIQVQNAESTLIDTQYNFLTSVTLHIIIQSTDYNHDVE